ncbi:MAG: DNA methyltransferase [Thermacetogeniaceae bacterium]
MAPPDKHKKPNTVAEQQLPPLDGRTWLRYSISIWDDLNKTAEERSFNHPAMFPQALTDRLITIFYRGKKGFVVDPFLGSGSTVCSAYSFGIPSVGFEIVPEYIELAEKRLASIQGDPSCYPQLIMDDARRIKEYLRPASVGLCITSPPYWNILRQRRSADGKPIRNYGNEKQDIGSIEDYQQFLDSLSSVFHGVYSCLIPGGYCLVNVMDIRKRSRFFPLHMDLSQVMEDIGFLLDDIIIWDRRQEYNNLRPLGYPYVFRVNKIHEYIMIYQKKA